MSCKGGDGGFRACVTLHIIFIHFFVTKKSIFEWHQFVSDEGDIFKKTTSILSPVGSFKQFSKCDIEFQLNSFRPPPVVGVTCDTIFTRPILDWRFNILRVKKKYHSEASNSSTFSYHTSWPLNLSMNWVSVLLYLRTSLNSCNDVIHK